MKQFFPASNSIPEFAEIAAKLAGLAASLPGPDNPFRQTLQQMPDLLFGPKASLATATSGINRAVYHLIGRGETIDIPETWIFCACMMLLALEKGRLTGELAPLSGSAKPS